MPCEFQSPRDLQGLEIFNNWAHVSVNVPGLLPMEHNTQTTPHLLDYKSISGPMMQNFTPFKEESAGSSGKSYYTFIENCKLKSGKCKPSI
jgi:hypothetical protein